MSRENVSLVNEIKTGSDYSDSTQAHLAELQ